MTYSSAHEFHVAVHGQLLRELLTYAMWYLVTGLAASAAWMYGGAGVYASVTKLSRHRDDRLRAAFEIDREAARGIHEIENYLSHPSTSA